MKGKECDWGVVAFIDSCVQSEREGVVTAAELADAYCAFIHERGYRPVSPTVRGIATAIGIALREAHQVLRVRRIVCDCREWAYQGVELK